MDTRTLATQFSEVIGPLDLCCLGVEWHPAGAHSLLRVYIEHLDAAREVVVEDCEAASREISAWLDVEDPISGQYQLEVSSPGLDRLLFSAEQVARAVGEKVRVKLRVAQAGSRRLKGTIVAVDGAMVRLDCAEQGEVTLDFADIEQARVEPDWAALGLAPAPRNEGRGHQKSKNNRARRRPGRS